MPLFGYKLFLISRRKEITEKLCGVTFSKSLVSRLCQDLDAQIEAWRTRSLTVAYPKAYRRRIRTTNSLERFHEEINRRSRVVRIFPNDASCLRLIGALAMEQSEEWLTSRRYLDMSLLEAFTPPAALSSAAD